MKTFIVKICVLLYILMPAGTTLADNYTERRIQIGTKIFSVLLAADLDLSRKADEQGFLSICLVYADDAAAAEKAAANIREKYSKIKKLPLKLELVPLSRIGADKYKQAAGIFLVQSLPDESLRTLIKHSMERRTLLYSPFEGDVEQGVPAGLSVEAKVQPYLNAAALKAAGLKIKPSLFRVSKLYE